MFVWAPAIEIDERIQFMQWHLSLGLLNVNPIFLKFVL